MTLDKLWSLSLSVFAFLTCEMRKKYITCFMRVRRLKWHTLQCQSSQMALVVKNPLANARDARDSGSIAGWGISSGGRNGNPLQYSCLENPMGRGAWQATVHRIANSRTRLKLVTMHYYTVPGTLLFHSKRYLWILITLFEWINWLLLLLLSRFSCVRLCAAYQVPPSLRFSRQEHWSGLPFPSPMHESEKWKWCHSVVSDS